MSELPETPAFDASGSPPEEYVQRANVILATLHNPSILNGPVCAEMKSAMVALEKARNTPSDSRALAKTALRMRLAGILVILLAAALFVVYTWFPQYFTPVPYILAFVLFLALWPITGSPLAGLIIAGVLLAGILFLFKKYVYPFTGIVAGLGLVVILLSLLVKKIGTWKRASREKQLTGMEKTVEEAKQKFYASRRDQLQSLSQEYHFYAPYDRRLEQLWQGTRYSVVSDENGDVLTETHTEPVDPLFDKERGVWKDQPAT